MSKLTIIMAVLLVLSATGCGLSNSKRNTKNKTVTEVKEMKTIQLTKADFKTKVMDYEKSKEWAFLGDKPAIIDFYADWCGPCRAVAPVLEEIAGEYEGKVDVYKVNVDNEQELAALFGVRSIPTLLFIPLNGEPKMQVGALSKSGFQDAIKEHLLK